MQRQRELRDEKGRVLERHFEDDFRYHTDNQVSVSDQRQGILKATKRVEKVSLA